MFSVIFRIGLVIIMVPCFRWNYCARSFWRLCVPRRHYHHHCYPDKEVMYFFNAFRYSFLSLSLSVLWLKQTSVHIFVLLEIASEGKNLCFAFLKHLDLVQGNFDVTRHVKCNLPPPINLFTLREEEWLAVKFSRNISSRISSFLLPRS